MCDYFAYRFGLVAAVALALTSCDEPSRVNLSGGAAMEAVSLDGQPATRLLVSGDADRTDDANPEASATKPLDIAFFKQAYSEDKANQAFQTEQEYITWVQAFYEAQATLFTPAGWNEQSRTLLARLDSPDTRASVRELANRLGKQIAVEWAKDKRAGKLDAVNDLLKWGGEMKKAAEQDDGSGQQIMETLTRIEREVAALVRDK